MPKKSIRDSLNAGLAIEEDAIKKRFANADVVLSIAEARKGQPAAPATRTDAEPGLSGVGEGTAEAHVDAKTVVKPVKDPQPRTQVIRITFSLTKEEVDQIRSIKRACNYQGFEVNQSELVRTAIQQLAKLSGDELKAIFATMKKVRPGNPNW